MFTDYMIEKNISPVPIIEAELSFKEKLKPRNETKYIVVHHSKIKTPHTIYDVHAWH